MRFVGTSFLLALLLLSCDRDPSGVECIEVSYPGPLDLWMYMQANTYVQWSGGTGDLVRRDIYKEGEFFTEYLGGTQNDGYEVRSDYLHPACHGSGHYQIFITDDDGNTGWSDNFTIMCGGLGDIAITYPSDAPVWSCGGSDAYV